MTTATLARMKPISKTSNKRPARLSDSKMTIYIFSRQPACGRPRSLASTSSGSVLCAICRC